MGFAIILGLVVLAIFLLSALSGAPYVPTHRQQARQVFTQLRPLDDDDILVDLGSGDGVVIKEALKVSQASAVGYEINPILVLISCWRLRKYSQRVRIMWRSFWRATAPDGVSVVYTFGESRDIKKMYDLVQRWANQTGRDIDFISYGFEIEGIKPISKVKAHTLYKITPLHSN